MENKICGIYKIENKVNGKIYIGQSINIPRRWRQHRTTAVDLAKEEYDYPLYRAIRKYGLENFDFSVLEYCEPKDLDEKEKFYIKKFQSFSEGYNQTAGGADGWHYSKINDNILAEIINLLKNSNLTQLEIADKFDLNFTTISYINNGKTLRQDNIEYPIRNNIKPKKYCVDCGKEICGESIRCNDCNFKYRRKDIPSKEKLFQLLTENKGNFTAVGKIFGRSGNAVVKWCQGYDLPYHTTDYKIKKQKQSIEDIKKKIIKVSRETFEELEQYPSIYQGALSIIKEGKSSDTPHGIGVHISDVCKGKRKTAYGYIWKYADN